MPLNFSVLTVYLIYRVGKQTIHQVKQQIISWRIIRIFGNFQSKVIAFQSFFSFLTFNWIPNACPFDKYYYPLYVYHLFSRYPCAALGGIQQCRGACRGPYEQRLGYNLWWRLGFCGLACSLSGAFWKWVDVFVYKDVFVCHKKLGKNGFRWGYSYWPNQSTKL